MIRNVKQYFKQLFCKHEENSMWSYIGEKYVFNCERCNKFFHVDNRIIHSRYSQYK